MRQHLCTLCALLLALSLAGCGRPADISAYGDTLITISGLADEDFTVTPYALAALKCVSRSDTGQTAKAGTVSVRGPTLETFLAQYEKKQTDFERIRFIASDKYKVVLREADLAKYEVVLGISSGSKPLPESERPLRILIPGAETNTWEYACIRIEFVAKTS
jgi:hypothetical protein